MRLVLGLTLAIMTIVPAHAETEEQKDYRLFSAAVEHAASCKGDVQFQQSLVALKRLAEAAAVPEASINSQLLKVNEISKVKLSVSECNNLTWALRDLVMAGL